MLFTVDKSRLKALGHTELSDELERGRIVYFPDCPLPLPDEPDLSFLRTELARGVVRKNVSYYPDADRLVGLDAGPEVLARARQILRTYSRNVHAFLTFALTDFFKGCRTGTSSFRPLQEKGRHLKPHASNELVHIDAGAYGATHGDRILRFFTNINPAEDRVWISKGTFAELYHRYGQAAGVRSSESQPLREQPWDRLYSGLIRSVSGPFPMLRVLDSSPYDRMMRRFHNYMKDTPAFQSDPRGHEQLAFKPFSSWMVLTDEVSHACVSGQYAMADTFLVPLRNCRLREQTPYAILKGELSPPAPSL